MARQILTEQETPVSEQEYKQLVKKNQDADRERVTGIAVLSEENKKALTEAIQYTNYYPDPITKDFQRKYILSDLEFATEESKLAQSVTELNVRTDNLMNDAYQFRKTELEIERLQVEAAGKRSGEDVQKKLDAIDADLLDLEIANKKVALRKIQLQSNARFREAMAWKANVEESLQKLGKDSIDQVDLDQVRMDLMRAKIRKWGELYAEGSFEMTPSKLQAIESERGAFEQGIRDGLEKLRAMLPAAAYQRRMQELGLPVK